MLEFVVINVKIWVNNVKYFNSYRLLNSVILIWAVLNSGPYTYGPLMKCF
jgi:hypothetical protein